MEKMEKIVKLFKDILKEEKEDEYGKYLRVFNPYFEEMNSTYEQQFEKAAFHGYIGDAVRAIREGHADSLVLNPHDAFGIEVRKHLDDVTSKYLRDKTIEGFADVKFAWAVHLYNGNAIVWNNKSQLLTENFGYDIPKSESHPILFNTGDEAHDWFNQWCDCALKSAELYEMRKSEGSSGFTVINELIESSGISTRFEGFVFDVIKAKKDNVRMVEYPFITKNMSVDFVQYLYTDKNTVNIHTSENTYSKKYMEVIKKWMK